MKKKFKGLVATSAMLVLLNSQAYAELIDIDKHWAEHDIKYLNEKGIITGYKDDSFRPEKFIKRSEFFAIVNRVFGFNDRTERSIKDVRESDWFHDDVLRAMNAGYVKGYSDGSIKPNDNISRQEAAKILKDVYRIKSSGEYLNFKDQDQVGQWAKESLAALVDNNYLSGYKDGTIRPRNFIKRAEVSKLLKGLTGDIISSADQIESKTFDGNLVLSHDDISLKNVTVDGNLYITEAANNSSLSFDQLKVRGKVFIEGNMDLELILTDAKFEELDISRDRGEHKIKLELRDDTEISQVKLSNNNHLHIGRGSKVDYVSMEENSRITVEGKLGKLSSSGRDNKVYVEEDGSLDRLEAEKDLELNDKDLEAGNYDKEDIDEKLDQAKDKDKKDKDSTGGSSGGGGGGGGGGQSKPEETVYTFVEKLEMKVQAEGERAQLKFSEDMDKPVKVEIYQGEKLIGEAGMTESPNYGTALVHLSEAGEYKMLVKDGDKQLAEIPLNVLEEEVKELFSRLKGLHAMRGNTIVGNYEDPHVNIKNRRSVMGQIEECKLDYANLCDTDKQLVNDNIVTVLEEDEGIAYFTKFFGRMNEIREAVKDLEDAKNKIEAGQEISEDEIIDAMKKYYNLDAIQKTIVNAEKIDFLKANIEEKQDELDLMEAVSKKKDEIAGMEISPEEKDGKTEESIKKAEEKLEELKEKAIKELEKAKTKEEVEAIEVDKKEALDLLEDKKDDQEEEAKELEELKKELEDKRKEAIEKEIEDVSDRPIDEMSKEEMQDEIADLEQKIKDQEEEAKELEELKKELEDKRKEAIEKEIEDVSDRPIDEMSKEEMQDEIADLEQKIKDQEEEAKDLEELKKELEDKRKEANEKEIEDVSDRPIDEMSKEEIQDEIADLEQKIKDQEEEEAKDLEELKKEAARIEKALKEDVIESDRGYIFENLEAVEKAVKDYLDADEKIKELVEISYEEIVEAYTKKNDARISVNDMVGKIARELDNEESSLESIDEVLDEIENFDEDLREYLREKEIELLKEKRDLLENKNKGLVSKFKDELEDLIKLIEELKGKLGKD